MQVFVLDLRPVKRYLLQNAVRARDRLFGSRIEDWAVRNLEFISRFEQFEERMSKCPTTVEEYSEVMESIADLDRSLPELITEIDLNNQIFEVLHKHRYLVGQKLMTDYWTVKLWPDQLREIAVMAGSQLDQSKERLVSSVVLQAKALLSEIEPLKQDVVGFVESGDLDQCDDQCKIVLDLEKEVDKYIFFVDQMRRRQSILDIDQLDVDCLADCKSALVVCKSGWSLCRDVCHGISDIFDLPIGSIDVDGITPVLEDWKSNIVDTIDGSSGRIVDVLNEARRRVGDLESRLPILRLLTESRLAPRHWKLIGEVLGPDQDIDSESSLQEALRYGIEDKIEAVSSICRKAKTEADNFSALDSIYAEISAIDIEVEILSDTGPTMERTVDSERIQNAIDAHLKTIRSISDTDCPELEERVRQVEKEMTSCISLVELIIACWTAWQVVSNQKDLERQNNEKDSLSSAYHRLRELVRDPNRSKSLVFLSRDCQVIETMNTIKQALQGIKSQTNSSNNQTS